MSSFRAERMIYGKLAGVDREHMLVGHSAGWPLAAGAPKGVGMPQGAAFRGACSLDWHAIGADWWLALSWCEFGPRITRRDFIQAHHILAEAHDFAPVLPFLPAVVAQMRQIPIFDQVNPALAPFVFELPTEATDEEWFQRHWPNLALVLSALRSGNTVFVHTRAPVEEKLMIVARLMQLLPPRVRSSMTFSTDEFGHQPYVRRLTFSPHNRAMNVVVWGDARANTTCCPRLDSSVVELGQVLANDGVAALIAALARLDEPATDRQASDRR